MNGYNSKFHGPRRTQQGLPLSRAELHIHLDGSVRLSTIWELCKQKNLPLPGIHHRFLVHCIFGPDLKGQCHEIFDLWFFRQSITPRP
jgi:hypothetical protein